MARETGQPNANAPHKGCNSSNCCSPAKLWRTLQTIIKSDNKKELIKFFKDARLEHIVRVALTSRVSNDAALYPPSQQHKIIRLTSRESMLYLGKSFTDLNSLQLALLVSSESMVITLLNQLKLHASPSELKHYVNHIWGQGNSSLHLASFLKRPQVVKLLLELGCASDVLNRRKKQAVECCLDDHVILKVFSMRESDVTLPSPIFHAEKDKILDNNKVPSREKKEPIPMEAKEVTLPILPSAMDTLVQTKESIDNHICSVESLEPVEMKTGLTDMERVVCYQWLLCFNKILLTCAQNQVRSDTIVQPNQCIPLTRLKKPPDIMVA